MAFGHDLLNLLHEKDETEIFNYFLNMFESLQGFRYGLVVDVLRCGEGCKFVMFLLAKVLCSI